MKTELNELLDAYGTEVVIARILEQLQLLALSEDKYCKDAIRNLVKTATCDTEYIYLLCEFSGLATYSSGKVSITDRPWADG